MRRSRNFLRRLGGGLRWLLMTVVVIAGLGAAYVLYEAATLQSAWASIERVSLDLSPTADTTTSTTLDASNSTTTSTESDATILEEAAAPPSVIALVGSDSRAGVEDLDDFGDFSGQRADVIVLAIRSGAKGTLLSVPRDLYVEDTCRGGRHRIGEAFEGCGERHGLAHLVGELENVTGLEIEHAVAVDLAGFQSVVDALGGYEICADHPLRDAKSGLELDAGCHQADGETTLAWLRSRHTEERVEGHWQPASSGSDLVRNERQRQFLMDMFHRLTDLSGPAAILDALRAAAPHLTVDDQLAMRDAAAWLWDFRRSDVDTVEIPVAGKTTSGGAAVLEPTVDLEEFITETVS